MRTLLQFTAYATTFTASDKLQVTCHAVMASAYSLITRAFCNSTSRYRIPVPADQHFFVSKKAPTITVHHIHSITHWYSRMSYKLRRSNVQEVELGSITSSLNKLELYFKARILERRIFNFERIFIYFLFNFNFLIFICF